MVRVTVKQKYNEVEFEFLNCEMAGKFMEVAMQTAVGNVKFEVEKAEEPAEVPPEEPAEVPQEEPATESRFVEPEEETF